jgi:hypothetical protein
MKIKRVLAFCIGLLLLVTTACGQNISSTFNPAVIEQRVVPANSVQMTFADYEVTELQIWNEQNRTMTIPLPIEFKDNRIPNLIIKKEKISYDSSESARKNKITIDGIQEGDTLLSPIEGDVDFSNGYTGLAGFDIRTKDSQGHDIVAWFSTTGLISPSIDVHKFIHVTKGEPIGIFTSSNKHNMFNGQIQITGFAPLLENFNLATTPDNKLIQIIK